MSSDQSEPEIPACPECGKRNYDSVWKPPSYVLRCLDCGWAVATTIFPPIHEDPRVFKVYLIPDGSDQLQSVIQLKDSRHVTSIEAKDLLAEERLLLMEGQAMDVLLKIEELESKGIVVDTQPEFRYTRDDLMGMDIR